MGDQNHLNSHCAFRCWANPTCLMIFKSLFFFFPSACQFSPSLSLIARPQSVHLYSLISPNPILETTSIPLSASIKMWNGSSNTKSWRSRHLHCSQNGIYWFGQGHSEIVPQLEEALEWVNLLVLSIQSLPSRKGVRSTDRLGILKNIFLQRQCIKQFVELNTK